MQSLEISGFEMELTLSGSVRGGSSGSIEPLDLEKKMKLNQVFFGFGVIGRSLFEPLDLKY